MTVRTDTIRRAVREHAALTLAGFARCLAALVGF